MVLTKGAWNGGMIKWCMWRSTNRDRRRALTSERSDQQVNEEGAVIDKQLEGRKPKVVWIYFLIKIYLTEKGEKRRERANKVL